MIAIDTIAVENEVADNMYQRSELDYLIYNDPVSYTHLIRYVCRRKSKLSDKTLSKHSHAHHKE